MRTSSLNVTTMHSSPWPNTLRNPSAAFCIDRRTGQDMAETAVAESAVIFVRIVPTMVGMLVERCSEARRQPGVTKFEQQALARRGRHVACRDECA